MPAFGWRFFGSRYRRGVVGARAIRPLRVACRSGAYPCARGGAASLRLCRSHVCVRSRRGVLVAPSPGASNPLGRLLRPLGGAFRSGVFPCGHSILSGGARFPPAVRGLRLSCCCAVVLPGWVLCRLSRSRSPRFRVSLPSWLARAGSWGLAFCSGLSWGPWLCLCWPCFRRDDPVKALSIGVVAGPVLRQCGPVAVLGCAGAALRGLLALAPVAVLALFGVPSFLCWHGRLAVDWPASPAALVRGCRVPGRCAGALRSSVAETSGCPPRLVLCFV